MRIQARLIKMAFQLLEKRFFDAKVARVEQFAAVLVLVRTSLVRRVLVVVDHILQRLGYIQHRQVAGIPNITKVL